MSNRNNSISTIAAIRTIAGMVYITTALTMGFLDLYDFVLGAIIIIATTLILLVVLIRCIHIEHLEEVRSQRQKETASLESNISALNKTLASYTDMTMALADGVDVKEAMSDINKAYATSKRAK